MIQFARLLAEIQACGIITTGAINTIADSMDLELDEINELLTRADTLWERSKAKLPK